MTKILKSVPTYPALPYSMGYGGTAAYSQWYVGVRIFLFSALLPCAL